MQYLVALAFLAIIASLATALFFMLRGTRDDASTDDADASSQAQRRAQRMARALAWRVGISVVLFVCVLIAWKMGVIHPTGIPAGK